MFLDLINELMKKLLFVFVLQLFCIGAFSQTVDIIGEDYVVAGSTHSYTARTSIIDPNYLYNWQIDGGSLIGWGQTVDVKWDNTISSIKRIRVHCIVQYRGDLTCDAVLYVHTLNGSATIVTTSPFGELCLKEPDVLGQYLPNLCSNSL